MSSIRDVLRAVLAGDGPLSAVLTGGIYTEEVTRQTTPDGFDANGVLRPCAVVRVSTETPAGPYARGSRAVATIYVYQDGGHTSIDAAIARIYDLLHQTKPADGIWEVRWADDLLDQEDPALDCNLGISRYTVTRLR